MEITREEIIQQAKKIVDFVKDNLELIGEPDINELPKDIELTYFVGIIKRQLILISDLEVLLRHSTHNGFTTLFIISRCILDDYIILKYIVNSDDQYNTIVDNTSVAYKKMFDKLKQLAEVNDKYINREYPFYPNEKTIDDLKNKMLANPDLDKIFKNKEEFKFKKFFSTADVIGKFKDEEYPSMIRVFYLWGIFSSYVHYSEFSYGLTRNENENNNNFLQEMLSYSYLTVFYSFPYIAKKLDIKLIDKHDLATFYKYSEEP